MTQGKGSNNNWRLGWSIDPGVYKRVSALAFSKEGGVLLLVVIRGNCWKTPLSLTHTGVHISSAFRLPWFKPMFTTPKPFISTCPSATISVHPFTTTAIISSETTMIRCGRVACRNGLSLVCKGILEFRSQTETEISRFSSRDTSSMNRSGNNLICCLHSTKE